MAEAARPALYVLTGPTASGKTAVALRVAAARGLEILAADSMSIYARMDIGTAKPTAEDRARIPHHGIDLVEPWQDFDTARYVAEADRVIADAARRGRTLLVAGGTPLYLMALLRGFFDGPGADRDLRARLAAEERAAPGALHDRLREVDPEAADRIHPHDAKRIVRALEVFELSGTPISSLQRQFDAGPPRYPYRIVGLEVGRETLHARVRARTRRMLDAGLVDEVRAILAAGGFSRTAGAAIGYREVLRFLDGDLAAGELETRIRSATRRLVRRQTTWVRRFPKMRRLAADPGSEDETARAIETALFAT